MDHGRHGLREPLIAIATAIATGIVIFLSVWVINELENDRDRREQRAVVASSVRSLKDGIEQRLLVELSPLTSLQGLVEYQQGQIDQEQFRSFASAVHPTSGKVQFLALARNGVVTHVFPEAARRRVLGHNLLTDPGLSRLSMQAVSERQVLLAGPLSLWDQASPALVGVLPIHLPRLKANGDPEALWGLAMVAVDIGGFLAKAGWPEAEKGLQLALLGQDDPDQTSTPIVGSAALLNEDPVIVPVTVAHGSWQIAALPKAGWAKVRPSSEVLMSLGALLAIIGAFAAGFLVTNEFWRRERQYSLIESENRFRQMFNGNPAVQLLISRRDGRIVDANPAAADFYGYPIERLRELMAQDWQVLSPDDIEGGLPLPLRSGATNRFEARHRLANGEIRDVDIRASVLSIGERSLLHIIVHDVSERKAAERALRESLDRLDSILNMAPMPIVISRLDDGQTVFLNRVGAAMFGDGLDGVTCNRLIDFFQDSADRVRYLSHLDRLAEVRELEVGLLARNHEPISVLLSATKLDFGDTPVALQVIRDITQRKQAEDRLREADQRLRDAIEATADGFSLFDAEDCLVLCNSAYSRLFGMLPEETVGLTYEQLGRSAVRSGIIRLDTGLSYDTWATARLQRHQRADGQPSEVALNDRWYILTERRCSDGGIVVIRTDVTEIKARELELEHIRDRLEAQAAELVATAEELRLAREQALTAQAAAERANRAKSEFLAHMSHELRTPLNAVIGFSEMMQQQFFGPLGSPKYEEYVRYVHESAEHLLSLINDILDLSKVEAGRHQLEEAALDTGGLIHTAVRLVRHRAANRGLAITVETGSLPAIRADDRALKQVLMNLLANAIKFTEPGGRIEVSGGIDSTGDVVIAIKDTGIGIPEAEIPRVMDAFSQASNTRRSGETGTGLGLSIAKALVELHGGRLTLASALGKGTTVSIHLPRERIVPTEVAA